MRGGFSLVEAIVAMTLLAVGALAVAGSGLLASRILREAVIEEEVSQRAGNLLDSLVAFGVNGAGTIRTPHDRVDWNATADSVAVTVRTANGATFNLRELR